MIFPFSPRFDPEQCHNLTLLASWVDGGPARAPPRSSAEKNGDWSVFGESSEQKKTLGFEQFQYVKYSN